MTQNQKKEIETLKDVDGIAEAILYFFKYILLKNYARILTFLIISGLIVFIVFSGYNCKTKWFEFNKQPIKIKDAVPLPN